MAGGAAEAKRPSAGRAANRGPHGAFDEFIFPPHPMAKGFCGGHSEYFG